MTTRTVLATTWAKDGGLAVLVEPEFGFCPKPDDVVTLGRSDRKVYVTTTVRAVSNDTYFRHYVYLNGFSEPVTLNDWDILFH